MFHQARFHVRDSTIPNRRYQFVHLEFLVYCTSLSSKIIPTSLTNMDTDTFTLDRRTSLSQSVLIKKDSPWFFFDQVRCSALDGLTLRDRLYEYSSDGRCTFFLSVSLSFYLSFPPTFFFALCLCLSLACYLPTNNLLGCASSSRSLVQLHILSLLLTQHRFLSFFLLLLVLRIRLCEKEKKLHISYRRYLDIAYSTDRKKGRCLLKKTHAHTR